MHPERARSETCQDSRQRPCSSLAGGKDRQQKGQRPGRPGEHCRSPTGRRISRPADLISLFIILTLSWAQAESVLLPLLKSLKNSASTSIRLCLPLSTMKNFFKGENKHTCSSCLPALHRQWGLHPPLPEQSWAGHSARLSPERTEDGRGTWGMERQGRRGEARRQTDAGYLPHVGPSGMMETHSLILQ